jgi:hypothetical protein
VTPRHATFVAQAASLAFVATATWLTWTADVSGGGSDIDAWGALGQIAILIVIVPLLVLGVVGLWRWATRRGHKALVYYDLFAVTIGLWLLRETSQQPGGVRNLTQDLASALLITFVVVTGVALYLVDRSRRRAA